MRKLIAIMVFALAPVTAAAQESPNEAQARGLFERGRSAYARELYTEAEDAFVAAYDAMPPGDARRTLILMSVAQSIERQGGRDGDALAAWQRFRAEAGDDAEAQHLQRADDRIRELSTRVARRGSEPEGPTETPASGFRPHWAGIVVTAVGGAALIAGAVVGAYGLAERGDVLSACDGTSCPPELRDRAAELETLGIAADAMLWPGLGIAAAGVVLMLLLQDEDAEAPVAAVCVRGTCGMGGRF